MDERIMRKEPPVSLLVRVLDEIDDVSRPVSAVLLKARRLAEELPGRKFKAWVQLEMNGYRGEEAKVPDYRGIAVTSTGNFIGAWQITHFVLPLGTLPQEIQDALGRHEFLDSAGALEGFLQGGRQAGRANLAVAWPEILIRHYQQNRIPGTPTHCVLVEAYKQIPIFTIEGVLYAVRSRLLEFLVQLGKDYPDLKANDAALASVPEGRLETLVQKVIIEGNQPAVNIFMADQQVQAGALNVGGSLVVANEVSGSFNGGQRR
jgi:hypothetical protein